MKGTCTQRRVSLTQQTGGNVPKGICFKFLDDLTFSITFMKNETNIFIFLFKCMLVRVEKNHDLIFFF